MCTIKEEWCTMAVAAGDVAVAIDTRNRQCG